MQEASVATVPMATTDERDRTARARIRDAAITRFARHGIAATSLKDIAADVGVSPPLIIHHFGSKKGLRAACDQHVVEVIRERKRAAMAAGGATLDSLEVLREMEHGPPLMKYLARTLAASSPDVAGLVDELVEDAISYTAEGVTNGLLKPSEYPRERVVVLTMWQLGALVLHEHIERLLGADVTSQGPGMVAWALPASEILAKGVLEEKFYERWRDALRAYETELTA